MDIKLIRNDGCHIWQTAEKELRAALQDINLPLDYEMIVVKEAEEAEKYKFYGSPQITVNGVDIDPKAKGASSFQVEGCRFFVWEGKMYEYPPKEMILSAINETKRV